MTDRTRPSNYRSTAGLTGAVYVMPVAVIMAALVLIPLIFTMIDSLYRVDPMRAGTPFVGLANYIQSFTDRNVLQSWNNTFVFVAMTVAIQIVLGLSSALLLNRVRFGRSILLAALVLPWCLPPVVNAVVWGWIFNPSYGVLNQILSTFGVVEPRHVWFNDRLTALFLIALVHAWRMMPLTAIILLASLQSIPRDLYEAARLDGAGAFGLFRLVTLPLISGGIAIALSQSTVFAFNMFDEAWILNGTSLDTRSIMIQVYMSAFQSLKFSYGMALSVLAMLASLIVSAVYVVRVYSETRYD
ncbi:MAG: sugar ABC transporter permease [Alphaproteobacteria bacterium]|mgnify:FL=1|nr:sugar ABC transporter permease [Alphaproteobacteria bacterium]MBU1548538.1 sugar ABC transporter permease [Alphaproteobacteria bacterium]MBU2337734.1 sugar ABC transporter permease [Alphaproteobacteria bacterium]MBU2389871.1 sugar ABC transporter permease [Alphaproteobacteria bacterium]